MCQSSFSLHKVVVVDVSAISRSAKRHLKVYSKRADYLHNKISGGGGGAGRGLSQGVCCCILVH